MPEAMPNPEDFREFIDELGNQALKSQLHTAALLFVQLAMSAADIRSEARKRGLPRHLADEITYQFINQCTGGGK